MNNCLGKGSRIHEVRFGYPNSEQDDIKFGYPNLVEGITKWNIYESEYC